MGSKSVLEVREGFLREAFQCFMPTPEMGLVAKELERVKAPQVTEITSHPTGCFTFPAVHHLASWGGWVSPALCPKTVGAS